jgi:Na+-transporting methylmalonyl-CoA/oxaloacetate decarboxylase gamma subunit
MASVMVILMTAVVVVGGVGDGNRRTWEEERGEIGRKERFLW